MHTGGFLTIHKNLTLNTSESVTCISIYQTFQIHTATYLVEASQIFQMHQSYYQGDYKASAHES